MVTLKNREFKEFKLVDIFSNVQRGKRLKKGDHKQGETPYVSSTSLNNGIDSYIGNKINVRIFEKCLTLANSGSVGATYYHQYKFIASDHVTKLENETFNKHIYLFISNILKRLDEKYSFNREINDNRLKKEKLLLPFNSKKQPDYKFMETYIKILEEQKEQKYLNYITERIENLRGVKEPLPLKDKKWKAFKLTNLFVFEKGDQNNMASIKEGIIPLVSAKKNENGYKGFASQVDKKLYVGNSLTLNNDGDGGAGISYYQPHSYLLDSHVTALYSICNLNKFTLLFISRCITLQRDKFGHGYSINNTRLKVFKLMLPTNSKEQPDYQYMEKYMKYLEYKKINTYLEFKKNKK